MQGKAVILADLKTVRTFRVVLFSRQNYSLDLYSRKTQSKCYVLLEKRCVYEMKAPGLSEILFYQVHTILQQEPAPYHTRNVYGDFSNPKNWSVQISFSIRYALNTKPPDCRITRNKNFLKPQPVHIQSDHRELPIMSPNGQRWHLFFKRRNHCAQVCGFPLSSNLEKEEAILGHSHDFRGYSDNLPTVRCHHLPQIMF